MIDNEIWHCVFCGRHWVGGPPTITARIATEDMSLRCCPFCQEYKGLEVCDPGTCDCWEIRVVPEIMDILRILSQSKGEKTDQQLAATTGLILQAITPPKERYKQCLSSSE